MVEDLISTRPIVFVNVAAIAHEPGRKHKDVLGLQMGLNRVEQRYVAPSIRLVSQPCNMLRDIANPGYELLIQIDECGSQLSGQKATASRFT
jgi:hypothetical protein